MPIELEPWSKLRARIPYSRTHVWRLVRAGKFPAPLKLSKNGRSAWRSDEVNEWILSKVAIKKEG